MTAGAWCCKVDESTEVFRWNETATVYFALTKLRRLAATCHRSLSIIKYSREEWKRLIEAAFPAERDFYSVMGEIMKRRKRPEEKYMKYYYDMLSLLQQCDIEGRKAVSHRWRNRRHCC